MLSGVLFESLFVQTALTNRGYSEIAYRGGIKILYYLGNHTNVLIMEKLITLILIIVFGGLNVNAQEFTYSKDNYYKDRTNVYDSKGELIGYMQKDDYYDKVNHYNVNGDILGSWEKDDRSGDVSYYDAPYSTSAKSKSGGVTVYTPDNDLATFNPTVQREFHSPDFSYALDALKNLQNLELQKSLSELDHSKWFYERQHELLLIFNSCENLYEEKEVLKSMERFYSLELSKGKRIRNENGVDIGLIKEAQKYANNRLKSVNAVIKMQGLKDGGLKMTDSAPILSSMDSYKPIGWIKNEFTMVKSFEGDYVKIDYDGNNAYVATSWIKRDSYDNYIVIKNPVKEEVSEGHQLNRYIAAKLFEKSPAPVTKPKQVYAPPEKNVVNNNRSNTTYIKQTNTKAATKPAEYKSVNKPIAKPSVPRNYIQFTAISEKDKSFSELEYLGQIYSEKVPNKSLYRYKVICHDPDYVLRELKSKGYKGAFLVK